jgi:hypothetical protein
MWQSYDWVWFVMFIGLIAIWGLIVWSIVDLIRAKHEEHSHPTAILSDRYTLRRHRS